MAAIPNSVRLAWRNLRVNTDPGSLVIILGLPAMYLIFMGSMFVSIVPKFVIGGYTFSYQSFLAGGILAFETVMAGTVGGSMLWGDRRFGMFAQILSGPFSRTEYLFGMILATVSASLAGSFALIVLGIALGGVFSISLLGVGLILLTLIVGGIFFCSLMLFVAAKVDSNQTYSSIQVLIIFVISFISNAYYPITSATPLPLRIISYMNPLTYVTDGIRAALVPQANMVRVFTFAPMLGALAAPFEMSLLIAETAAMFLIAYWTYRNVRVSMS
jgi:ABC-2 type transport system permease protein